MAATGAQLERICRRLRRATEGEREMAEDRRFRARPLGDGLVKLELVLSSDEADLIIQAVERAKKRLANASTTAADGLMEVTSSYLAGRSAIDDASAEAPRAEVVVHLERDPTTAELVLDASLEDGADVSAETLRRLACDSGVVLATLDHERNVLDVGRRTRSIFAAPSGSAIAPAASLAADRPVSCTATTSTTGCTAARPHSKISCRFAASTTG